MDWVGRAPRKGGEGGGEKKGGEEGGGGEGKEGGREGFKFSGFNKFTLQFPFSLSSFPPSLPPSLPPSSPSFTSCSRRASKWGCRDSTLVMMTADELHAKSKRPSPVLVRDRPPCHEEMGGRREGGREGGF